MEENTFEKIEAYLAGELSEAETRAFELEVQADASLAEEVSLQRDTHSLLALGNQLEYKTKLKTIDKEMQATPKVRPLFANARVWLAAAAIIIGVSVVLWSMGRSSNGMYADQFSPYPDLTSMRNDTLNDLRTGMIAYTESQYELAIDYFEKFEADHPVEDYVHLYKGNAYLALEQYDKAIAELKRVKSLTWQQPAAWYLALAYGASGQKEAATKLLKQIAEDENHAYKDKAEGLL